MVLDPGGVDPGPTFKKDLEPNVKIKTSQGQIQFIPLTIKTNIEHLNFKIRMKKRETLIYYRERKTEKR